MRTSWYRPPPTSAASVRYDLNNPFLLKSQGISMEPLCVQKNVKM
jgi:hypothetical protein